MEGLRELRITHMPSAARKRYIPAPLQKKERKKRQQITENSHSNNGQNQLSSSPPSTSSTKSPKPHNSCGCQNWSTAYLYLYIPVNVHTRTSTYTYKYTFDTLNSRYLYSKTEPTQKQNPNESQPSPLTPQAEPQISSLCTGLPARGVQPISSYNYFSFPPNPHPQNSIGQHVWGIGRNRMTPLFLAGSGDYWLTWYFVLPHTRMESHLAAA